MSTSSPQAAPLDRYVVLNYLAEGGMGAIYLGKRLGAGGFEREVVLKQLLPEFTSQQEFIDLFLREARLSATLDHANIIHTIDLVTAGDEYFIVMEYLDGADLRTLLKKSKLRKRHVSPAAAIYIARETLSALAYAHAKNGSDGHPLHLIHRDVSPSNILVSRNGEVKLTDFGIAKASTHKSIFYRVKGKVGYMSPEQARSEPLDHRSDVYSLAVCLYELICGERLFVHANLLATPEEIYGQPLPPLSTKIAGLPREFDDVMAKALNDNIDARYQSAGEFQEALSRVAYRHGLMMSGPELSEHLRETCGPPAQWRDLDEDSESVGGAEGTELYEVESSFAEADSLLLADSDVEFIGDDSDYDDHEVAELDQVISVANKNWAEHLVNAANSRGDRVGTSVTNLHRLQGVELTSIVQAAELAPLGAEPLADLSNLARSALIEDQRSPEEIAKATSAYEPPTSSATAQASSLSSSLVRARRPWLPAVIVGVSVVVACVLAFWIAGRGGSSDSVDAPDGLELSLPASWHKWMPQTGTQPGAAPKIEGSRP